MDVKSIIGKSLALVENELGKGLPLGKVTPSRVPQDIMHSFKASFSEGAIEVVFIDGVADWITINSPKIRFDENVLDFLKLDNQQCDFKNENVIRWKNVGPITSIEAFNLNGNVDYILIKGLED